MRTGDLFECTEERYAEIERFGHHIEPVPDEEDMTSKEHKRLSAMSEDELRLYADLHFKLTFHSGVRKREMIASILAREKG